MRLTDVVSNLDLSVFPIVALVFFLIAFVMIAAGVLRTGRARARSYAQMPLDDAPLAPEQNRDKEAAR